MNNNNTHLFHGPGQGGGDHFAPKSYESRAFRWILFAGQLWHETIHKKRPPDVTFLIINNIVRGGTSRKRRTDVRCSLDSQPSGFDWSYH
jgi:hypothetical protein